MCRRLDTASRFDFFLAFLWNEPRQTTPHRTLSIWLDGLEKYKEWKKKKAKGPGHLTLSADFRSFNSLSVLQFYRSRVRRIRQTAFIQTYPHPKMFFSEPPIIIPPASVIATWPTPNYKNPATRGNGVTIINAILISLSVILVALRLYVRIAIIKWFGLDDFFLILALVSSGSCPRCTVAVFKMR